MAIINTGLTNTGPAPSIYTSSGNSAVVTIHLCNYGAASQTVNVYVVPSGTVANNTNIIYASLTATGLNTYVINAEKFILSNGDRICANCGTSGNVSATVSYIGI
jgi:hypothetical protein